MHISIILVNVRVLGRGQGIGGVGGGNGRRAEVVGAGWVLARRRNHARGPSGVGLNRRCDRRLSLRVDGGGRVADGAKA